MSEELDPITKEVIELRHFNKLLVNQLHQEKEDYAKLRLENERLRDTIYRANQDYKELRRENEQLKMKIEKRKGEIELLSSKLGEF